MFEVVDKCVSDALGVLQEVSSTIEQRLEDIFGPRPGSKAQDRSDVVETTAKESPADEKKAASYEATTNNETRKAPVTTAKAKKKAPAKKKAAAKKAPAKKKAAAKKAPAKKKAAAKKKK